MLMAVLSLLSQGYLNNHLFGSLITIYHLLYNRKTLIWVMVQNVLFSLENSGHYYLQGDYNLRRTRGGGASYFSKT